MLRRNAAAPPAPVTLALTLVALLLAAPAARAGQWVAPLSFPRPSSDYFGGTPLEDQIRYQDGGIATEAFLQIVSTSPLATELHVGLLAPGGSYADQLAIASTAGAIPASVEIAVAPDGAAVAGWSELTGPDAETAPYRYRATYRPAGSGTWEAPVTIATEAVRESGVAPGVVPAISADGTAAVGVEYDADEAGKGESEPTARIDVAVRSTGGAWSTQRISPPAESAASLRLGFDGTGDLTAAYTLRFSEGSSDATSDDRTTVIAQRRPASSGVWGPREDISGSEIQWSVYALQLGENEAGDAAIAYQYAGASSDAWAATRAGSTGPWTAPAQLVTGAATNSIPQSAGVAPNGTAYVLYSFAGSSSAEDCTGVVRAPAGDSFTPARCVSPTNELGLAGSLAFLGEDAYFAWTGSDPEEMSDTSIQGARWVDGASLPDAAQNLDQPGDKYGAPTLVEDRQGSVVAFYTDATTATLRASAYDGGPPILLGAGVPASATAGLPVALSADFVDLWSGLGAGQPTWSFGDGTAPASGASVMHTFAVAGTYTIALGAADVLGNATSATYTIVVRPAPQSPPAGVLRPRVTLDTPACPRKLSAKACKRRRSSTAAWRTLRGTASDPTTSSVIARVQVAFYLTQGKRVLGLRGGRLRKTTRAKARATFVTATLRRDTWSLKLPQLSAGSYTILVRATDRAGQSSALLTRTVRLR
jgi:hypothetical protein